MPVKIYWLHNFENASRLGATCNGAFLFAGSGKKRHGVTQNTILALKDLERKE